MKQLGILSTLALILLSGSLFAQRIYKVNTADNAQVKVYVTNNAEEADLKVFETLQPEAVVKDGIWYQPMTESEADIKVFITTEASQADMKIFYVTDVEQAGWITREKRQLFKVQK
jgi:hypothetical protein